LINTSKIRVFALFDDSSADEVIFSYFGAPSSQDIPIRTFSNDIQDIDVQRSVLDGASGALASYEHYFKSSGDRYCFAYKFSKDETNQAITGKSAGLAFCLKFSLKLYKNIIDTDSAYSIAATGILEIDEEVTHIKPVEKINKKLEAALNCLNSGDLLFYPLANENQINQELKNKIIKKGISVKAIDNVNQVMELLFKGHIDKSTSKKFTAVTKIKWALVPMLLIILGSSFYLIFYNETISCYGQVIKFLESGEYLRAKTITERCLKETENDSLQLLLNQINSELTLSSNFIYIKNNDSITKEEGVNSPLLLGTEDGYKFEIQASLDCFLYILQFDSEINSERLFPLSPFILNQHHLLKNRLLQVPGGENMFYLDDKNHHGIITIFIIASLWRLTDLENIYNKYEVNENRQLRRDLFNDLINKIKQLSYIKNSDINSLFLNELSFIQK